MRKKSARRVRPLLQGYLEKISSDVFDEYADELTQLVGKQHGVYALYNGDKLHYVGLATNLKNRVKQHNRDKHKGKWDKFSMYLVRKADHSRELEALIMRIAEPNGNTARGKLSHALNLNGELMASIKESQLARLNELVSVEKRRKRNTSTSSRSKTNRKRTRSSKPQLERAIRIKGTYKGKTYNAVYNKSGTIRFNGQSYATPSAAGVAARKCSTNGWSFWKFRNTKGEWVKLRELR